MIRKTTTKENEMTDEWDNLEEIKRRKAVVLRLYRELLDGLTEAEMAELYAEANDWQKAEIIEAVNRLG